MLSLLAQVASMPEPPPAGWGGAAEATLRHAESNPAVFFAIAATVLPVLCVALVLFVFFRWGLPTFREEARLGREHLASLLRQRGEESAADIAAARELSREQNKNLVDRVELKIDGLRTEINRTDERVSRLGEVVSRVAAKIGAVVIVLMAFTGGALVGVGSSTGQPAYVVPTSSPIPACFQAVAKEARHECPKGCAKGQHCCGENKCCEDKKATAATASEPRSALLVADLHNVASSACDARFSLCR